MAFAIKSFNQYKLFVFNSLCVLHQSFRDNKTKNTNNFLFTINSFKMKKLNLAFVLLLSASLIFSGCDSLNKTAQGALIGTGAGAAIGAGIGALIGKDGKSAAVGAAIGSAVGVTAGAIIGKKMDKAAAEAARVEGAQVETIEDINGLKAVKVTFDSGILFAFNSSALNTSSKEALANLQKYWLKILQWILPCLDILTT